MNGLHPIRGSPVPISGLFALFSEKEEELWEVRMVRYRDIDDYPLQKMSIERYNLLIADDVNHSLFCFSINHGPSIPVIEVGERSTDIQYKDDYFEFVLQTYFRKQVHIYRVMKENVFITKVFPGDFPIKKPYLNHIFLSNEQYHLLVALNAVNLIVYIP